METQQIISALTHIMSEHKDDQVPTFGICLYDMARDCKEKIEELSNVEDSVDGKINVLTNLYMREYQAINGTGLTDSSTEIKAALTEFARWYTVKMRK